MIEIGHTVELTEDTVFHCRIGSDEYNRSMPMGIVGKVIALSDTHACVYFPPTDQFWVVFGKLKVIGDAYMPPYGGIPFGYYQ